MLIKIVFAWDESFHIGVIRRSVVRWGGARQLVQHRAARPRN